MSAKVKLISFISAFILVLGIMIIGVLSAEQVNVNIGGSVSFNATNVYAKVSGNISGAETGNKTFSTLTYSAEETTGNESDWTNLVLNFNSDASPILIEITVENLSTDRELQVSLENDIQASGLNISITKDSQPYTAGQTAMLAKSTGDGSSATTFVMSLTVANPDEDLTDANFNYILNLTDETAIKEITAQSSDSSMGSVTGSGTFVIGDQVTLTATPGTDYLFTEWRANSAEGERVSGNSTYTFTLTSTSPTTYYAVFEQAQPGTLTYTYSSDTEAVKTATVSGCTSGANVVVIPETTMYNGETYTVTGIAGGTSSSSSPFYSTRSTLKSITIPSTIETIGNNAFNNCRALTEINYNATNATDLTSNNYVFYYAGRDGDGIIVNIGANVTRLPNYIFCPFNNASYTPNITTVNFAEGSVCESIGDYAFADCYYLTSITIPASVTSIGEHAFEYCDSLTSITIPDSVTSINPNAFYHCSSLTSITFGDNSQLTSIGEWAFYYCDSITSITIPDRVTSIGSSAFTNCYALAEVYNYSGLTITAGNSNNGVVGYYAKVIHDLNPEDSKPATRIKDYNGVRYYDDGENTVVALYPLSKDITTVSLDSRTTEIQPGAFEDCSSLTTITIPDRVTSIGFSAFEDCSELTSITIPDSVTFISSGAFNGCSGLVYNTDESGVNYLGNDTNEYLVLMNDGALSSAFYTIPSTCKVIYFNAFSKNTTLEDITISEGVTNIGSYAFHGCSSLNSAIFENTTGWFITGGQSISLLGNKSTAATYLKSSYAGTDWYRS